MSIDTILSKAKTVTIGKEDDTPKVYTLTNFKSGKVFKVLECTSELAGTLGGPEVLTMVDKAMAYLLLPDNEKEGDNQAGVITVIARMAVEALSSLPGTLKAAREPLYKFLGSLVSSNSEYAKAIIEDEDIDLNLIVKGKEIMAVASLSEVAEIITISVEFMAMEVQRTQLPPLLAAIKKLR